MIEYVVKVNNYDDRFWYKDGVLHREDGPAVEYEDGDKAWYKNGIIHRDDGPALEYLEGIKKWYLNGEELSEEEFIKRTNSHTVVIDGKKLVISSKSFNSLREFFNNHS